MLCVSASIEGIKAAIISSWLPILCIAALAVAIIGIIILVNTITSLITLANKVIAAVKAKVKNGGVDKNRLGDNTVYVIVYKGTYDVQYVGRTRNYRAREYYHQRRPGAVYKTSEYTMWPIATFLTLPAARALEQAIITAYGINNLGNTINSIAQLNWGAFQSSFRTMFSLLASYIDPE